MNATFNDKQYNKTRIIEEKKRNNKTYIILKNLQKKREIKNDLRANELSTLVNRRKLKCRLKIDLNK